MLLLFVPKHLEADERFAMMPRGVSGDGLATARRRLCGAGIYKALSKVWPRAYWCFSQNCRARLSAGRPTIKTRADVEMLRARRKCTSCDRCRDLAVRWRCSVRRGSRQHRSIGDPESRAQTFKMARSWIRRGLGRRRIV